MNLRHFYYSDVDVTPTEELHVLHDDSMEAKLRTLGNALGHELFVSTSSYEV